jgi:hypothetical protein
MVVEIINSPEGKGNEEAIGEARDGAIIKRGIKDETVLINYLSFLKTRL